MTEEVEAVAAPQVAVEQHTCGEEDGHTLYPAALASQQAVFEDGELFTRLLQDLNAKLQTAQPKKYRPSKYRVPTVAGKDLSLHALYRQVTGFGGVMAVAADNKWSEIIASFSFQAKVNLSAIKRIYSSLLWHFEQVYLHNASGQQLQEPPELPAGSVDPALQDGAAAGAASRPARNRRGTSLAALIAASDGIYSEEMDDADAPAAAAGADVGKSSDGAAAAATGKAAADGKTPPPAAAAGKEGGKPPQQQHRSRAPSQQRGGGSSGAGAAAAPARAPDLVGFMKAGRARKDLTGQAVAGRVDARFDCGYFVSLNIAGQSFSGILYCPTAVAAAAAAGAAGQGAGRAAVKREEGGAEGRKGGAAANGSAGVKRDAATAAGGEGGEAVQRGTKRRRGPALSADPASASKPKSAKTAFNYFAAEQWPLVKAELGPGAVPQEISRAVGERWNKTTDAERQPYIERSSEDKERFEKAMADWRQGLESPGSGAAAAGKEAPAAAAASPAASPAPTAAAGGEAAAAAAVAADVMDVDADASAGHQPQQYKHKLKLKLGQHGVMGPPSKGALASPSPVAAATVPEQHAQAAEAAAARPAAAEMAAQQHAGEPAAPPVAAEMAAQQQAGEPAAPPAAAEMAAQQHAGEQAAGAATAVDVVAAPPAAAAVLHQPPAAAAPVPVAEPAAAAVPPQPMQQ